MRIAVNLRLYVKGEIGGLENYIRHVVSALDAKQSVAGSPLTIFAHVKEADNVRELAPEATIVPVVHDTAVAAMESELARGNFDLLFCPLLVLDPMKVKIPSAVMMPDLQHEFFPEFFDSDTLKWRRQTYRPSTIHATQIFTLSEHAKKTIIDNFRVDPAKIEVIYLDVDDEFRDFQPSEASAAFRALQLPEQFLFYPANFWPHKNHANLLHAFKILLARRPNLGLVLTGAETGSESVRKLIKELELQRNIFLPGYVDRSVLVELYRHASALTFISRFEGFGIPILEAFHAGTPVVTSRAGSCEEIAGGAAAVVDPIDPFAIAAGIDSVLSDSSLRERLIAAGHERSRHFSWDRAFRLTLAAFERITTGVKERVPRIEVEGYPVVSVVTPSYNMGRFIRHTVDSVLNQDYPHIDYIVMDAGSKDDTVEILNSYSGRLRFESKPDKGQADAVNKGFSISRGQIFTFLNADDTYLPGAVGTAVTHMLANPTMGVVYGEANYVREDGTVIGRYPTLPFDAQVLNHRCFICQPAAFMWSDVFQTAGFMNPDLHYALDYDLWMRIAKLFPMLKVDDYLATSRMYRENKTLGMRRPVYMEIMSAAKVHYGYVPFDWVFGYASYLLDRKDQFFDVSHPSLPKIILSLALGSYYNKTQMPRYWREWGLHLGFAGSFEGRYGDGWISRRYVHECEVGANCRAIHIAGRHLAPLKEGLNLSVKLENAVIGGIEVKEHGPFQLDMSCPAEFRDRKVRLILQANRTFRPGANGDYRRLSCLIDSIVFEGNE
jgi:glycosyltransferase involved in cell wall biosynthesis